MTHISVPALRRHETGRQCHVHRRNHRPWTTNGHFIHSYVYLCTSTSTQYCTSTSTMYEYASVWVLVVWNKEEMDCSAAVKGNGVHGTFVRRLEQMATRLCFENRCVIRKRLQLHEFKFDDCSNEIGVFSLLTNAYCLVANGGSENFYRCVLSD